MEKLFKFRIYDNEEEFDEIEQTSNDSDYSNDFNYESKSDENDTKQNGGYGKKQLKRKRNVSLSSEDGIKIRKLPTRRPDPTIKNRNALLARENRRKKKEMFNQLEINFKKIQDENKNLRKILKQQNNKIEKLNNEQLYLRSIISNRTEILTLLKTVSSSRLPITSSEFNMKIEKPKLNSIEQNDFINIKTETDDQTIYHINEWDNLLNLDDIPIFEDEINNKTNVESEHNYYTTDSDKINKQNQTPGICFHISSGKVSLEFCAQCHNKAQNAWLED